MITQTQEDAILKEIWKGIYTVDNLPVPVYKENLKELTKGVAEGWGVALKDIPKERLKFKTLDSLVHNVDSFSAAKTFHQVADMEFLKVDKAGNIIPFSKFKKEAGTVFNTYNRNWLKTEFNTSKSQSQSAAQWSRIQAQKKDLPMLKYQTSGDERVRDEHVAWDGIIKPVDDPFWNTVSAPNGYNCRCEIIQLSSGKPTNLDTHLKKVNTQFKKEGKKPLKNLNNTAPLFSDNVGKTGQVFNKNEHPYFDAPKSKLDTNFGLPVTQTLLKKVVKPKKVTKKQTSATSIKEAEKNQKQWIDNTLTSNEAKAIEDWTSGDYRFINAELRYGDKLEIHGLPDKRISEIKKNTALMEGILKESPKYEGKVYRGTKFQYENQRDEFLQGLGKGDIFTDKGYMSTSYDKSVVSEFQRPGTFNVTFDINSKKGTMIDQLSRRGDEKEILLNKNSSFIIDSVLKENNGNVVVKMTEM